VTLTPVIVGASLHKDFAGLGVMNGRCAHMGTRSGLAMSRQADQISVMRFAPQCN